jgi:hypothetical protein
MVSAAAVEQTSANTDRPSNWSADFATVRKPIAVRLAAEVQPFLRYGGAVSLGTSGNMPGWSHDAGRTACGSQPF